MIVHAAIHGLGPAAGRRPLTGDVPAALTAIGGIPAGSRGSRYRRASTPPVEAPIRRILLGPIGEVGRDSRGGATGVPPARDRPATRRDRATAFTWNASW